MLIIIRPEKFLRTCAVKKVCKQAEDLLIKTARGEDTNKEFDSVTGFFGDDFNEHRLSSQLTSLALQLHGLKELHFQDTLTYLKTFSSAERIIFSEVVNPVKIILVNPATS